MKILVTGSTGFVGSSIISRFERDENLHIDTISRSRHRPSSQRIKRNHYVMDISSREFEDFMQFKKFDLLVHAAWHGLPNRDVTNNAINLDLSSLLFERFLEAGGKAIVGIGSCLEYGTFQGPVSEEALGKDILDFGATKRAVLTKLSQLGIPYLWLRPFYLYGQNQHSKSLFNLALSHISDEDYLWMREPFASNDFVYVDDLSRLVHLLVKRELWLSELNVGTSSLVQNITFVNSIRNLLGKDRYQHSYSANQGISADLEKLRKYLPDFQFLSVHEGLALLLQKHQIGFN